MSDLDTSPEVSRAQRHPQPTYWPDQADDEIDLFELWDIVWSGRWLIRASTFVFSVASVIYALTATEIYEAKVVMLPADDDQGGGLSSLAGQFGGLASLAGVSLGGGGGKADEAKAVLESYAFTAQFIEDLDLIQLLCPDDSAGEPKASIQHAVRVFRDDIRRVSTDKTSGAVTLTIAWTDPDQAASWANQLVERLNATLRGQDVMEAQKSLDFLNQTLQKTSVVEMQQTIYRLIETQTKTVMLANVRDDYVFSVIDPAYPPEQRTKPKRALICILGGMLGGFVGILVVFARRVVNSYQSRAQLAS